MTSPQAHKTLLIIPIVVFILSAMLVNAEGPYYMGGNIDPEYCELTNAVSALTFHVPPNTSHPGTTLHVLGALVILFKWLLGCFTGQWSPLESSVFLDAESYLHAINLVVNVLLALSLYYAARAIYRASGSLLAALTLQVSVFLFPQTLAALPRTSPEPLLMVIGFALMAPLTGLLFEVEPAAASGNKLAGRAGVLFALGVVTKANFLPLGSILLLLRNHRQRLWFLLCGLAAALLFLLPSASKFAEKMQWFTSLVSHKGFYGSGPASLQESSVVSGNVRDLFGNDPALFFLFVLYVGFLALSYFVPSRKSNPSVSRLRSVLLSGCIAILVGSILTLQHFRAHYMVPSLVWVSFLNAMLVVDYRSLGLPRLVERCILLAGALVVVVGVGHTATGIALSAEGMREYQEDARGWAKELKTMPGCLQMGYYTTSIWTYALHWGDELSSNQHRKALADLYPDSFFYGQTDGRFYDFTRDDRSDYVIGLVKKGKCVVVQGSVLPREEMVLPKGLFWKPLSVRKTQAIYALTEGDADPAIPATGAPVKTDGILTQNSHPQLIGPPSGSVLTTSPVVFTWMPVRGASDYWIDVGTTVGKGNVFGGYTKGKTFATIDLKQCLTGRPVYVQLFSLFPDGPAPAPGTGAKFEYPTAAPH